MRKDDVGKTEVEFFNPDDLYEEISQKANELMNLCRENNVQVIVAMVVQDLLKQTEKTFIESHGFNSSLLGLSVKITDEITLAGEIEKDDSYLSIDDVGDQG